MREGGKEYFVSSSNFGFDFVFEANFAGGNMSVCPSRSPFLSPPLRFSFDQVYLSLPRGRGRRRADSIADNESTFFVTTHELRHPLSSILTPG